MRKIDLGKLYQKQISLTEWFDQSGHKDTEKIRIEDNDRDNRMELLSTIIDFPFAKPVRFTTTDLLQITPGFKEYLQKHTRELCCVRLVPKDPKLPKFRMRGKTVKKSLEWFLEQKINHNKYRVEFIPHGAHQLWSTTFIVNNHGIFGEITRGGHYQLTQGFYDTGDPIGFYFDFEKLTFSKNNPKAKKQLLKFIQYLKVGSPQTRKVLSKRVGARFAHSYLPGYFEAVITGEFGLWFIDYNRAIADLYQNYIPSINRVEKHSEVISGLVASPGTAQGAASIVSAENLDKSVISEQVILICEMTTPDYLPLVKKSLGVVTDQGGVLSHAAIICRELGKPCVTNTKNATQIIKDGDLIEVDANQGIIRII